MERRSLNSSGVALNAVKIETIGIVVYDFVTMTKQRQISKVSKNDRGRADLPQL